MQRMANMNEIGGLSLAFRLNWDFLMALGTVLAALLAGSFLAQALPLFS